MTGSASTYGNMTRRIVSVSARFRGDHYSATNFFASATARGPRSLCPAPATLTKRLGARKIIQTLAELHGDDKVVLAVYYQHRRGDLANAQIRAKLILHEKPHRQEPIVSRADIGR